MKNNFMLAAAGQAGGGGGGISLIGIEVSYNSNAGSDKSILCTVPSGIVAGDLLLVLLNCDTYPFFSFNWTVTSGWTINYGNMTVIASKISDGTESFVSFTDTNGSIYGPIRGYVLAYRGAAFDTYSVGATSFDGDGTPRIAPSINLAASDSVLLAFFTTSREANTTDFSTPAGFSVIAANYNNGYGIPDEVIFEKTAVASGATGNVECYYTGVNFTSRGSLIGITPI